jgi:hypothetical protein
MAQTPPLDLGKVENNTEALLGLLSDQLRLLFVEEQMKLSKMDPDFVAERTRLLNQIANKREFFGFDEG